MFKTLYLGNIYGTKIYIHWSFWILALIVFLSNLSQGFGAAVSAVGFVFSVFACVFLHELGHAWAARRFGRPTLDITLLPIGGIARIQGGTLDPWPDGWIAIAGPLVNFAIAAILGLGLSVGALPSMDFTKINLLPWVPLDGGRILRSLLCYFTSRPRAIEYSARIGQWGAGFLILFFLWNLDFVGVLFGIVLYGINSLQRLQSKLIVIQQSGRSWPFPVNPNEPFGFDPPQWPRRSDTIDAEQVRQVDQTYDYDEGFDQDQRRNFPRP